MINQESNEGRKNKQIPIIAVVIVFVILVGSVLGLFLYRIHIDKQAESVIGYIDGSEYDKALALYNKYKGHNKSFDDRILTNLRDTIEQIKEDYMSEDMDYSLAMNHLDSLNVFDILGFDLIIHDAASWIDKINTSRKNYQDGKAFYEQGEYEVALEKYGLVLKDDSKYHDLAANDIANILKIEADIEEDEYNKMALSVSEFESNSFSYSYTEDEKEYMFTEFVLPVLIGENPAYEAINHTFENAREDYMIEVSRMAEDARLNMNEEYFIPSSFGIAYSVVYNNNGILCILLTGHTYAGGAHGFPLQETFTFDLATGNRLELSDLISADDKAFAQLVVDEFQRMYNEAPEEYWEDSLDLVKENASDIDGLRYFITNDSICIYYFPYDLGSYARGFVDIIIPYKGNEDLFGFNYMQ